ncbi:uncharacterized protein LOC105178959 [Sesamum indicum]|uniref:Uncharacterized protein LOC105178959 n=1 Tax=Sesamum indicum TaxID=4182 RepID=A0A6I9UKA9_SESIN|nr:uncharacterized protein LOC105178959 [Sesamum indicum]
MPQWNMKEGLRLRWSRRPRKDNSSKAENCRENLGNQASRSTEAEGRHRFRVPDLQRYDGTKDPYEHIAAFEMVMNLYGQPGPIMAKLFATTLTGKAQECKKKQKRSATHLFNICQRDDETLKSFMERFSNETLELQDLRIHMIVSILIHGLKKGPFTSALARDPSSDVEQVMALAQKYIDEEEMNAMKDSERREREQAYRRPHDTREDGGNRMKSDKPREPKYQPKYHNYAPLNMSREKAVLMVENCGKDIFANKFPVGARFVKTKSGGVDRERNPGLSKTDKVPANRSNAPTKGVIYTIVGGSSVGDSQRTQKRCARTLGSSREREFVLKVEEEEAISFDSSDRAYET